MEQIFIQIQEWVRSIDWYAVYIEVRNVGIGFNILLFGLLVFALTKAYHVRPKLIPLRKFGKKTLTLRSEVMKENWQKVVGRAHSSPPQSLTIGIIEADSFVDESLKRMGLKGEHMADRLEHISPDEVRSLNNLWTAHRIRNDLVHTPGFTVSEEEADKILGYYEEFLKELGVI